MKVRILFVVIVLASLLAACGGAAQAPAAQQAATPLRIAVVMPSTTTDLAISQSMWEALKKIQTEMGGESAVELKYSESMTKVADAAAAMREYASQGFDIVIAHGSQYGSSVQEVAPDFPKTTFAWGNNTDTFKLANVYAYLPAAEQGGYVNGVMAAMLTKSKVIGVTGPVEAGDAKTYVAGFVQGVTATDASVKVSKTWTGSFSDVALMTEAAKTHIAAGADVLTGSSQSSVGSIGAAKESGAVLWFGTQQDQSSLAPANVVASQQYDWTIALKQVIANRKNGKLGGEAFTLNLQNGGLKMAYNAAYKLPDDVKAAAEKAIAGIKDGSIKVSPQ